MPEPTIYAVAAPRFTVVIPAFNEERYIASAIDSVLGQTESSWEAIVVDDGSTDATLGRVEPFAADPRVSVLSQPQNAGLSAALNAGVRAARGELVSLLDADDMLMPAYLRQMAAALDAEPSAGFAHTDAWVFVPGPDRFRRRTATAPWVPKTGVPRDRQGLMLALIETENFICARATIRRSVFDKVGGYDERLSACEDYEMWLRILAAGYEAARAPGELAILRDRADSMSADGDSMYRNLVALFGRLAEDESLEAEFRAAAADRRARLEASHAHGDDDGPPGLPHPKSLARTARRLTKGALGWRRKPPPGVLEAFPGLKGL